MIDWSNKHDEDADAIEAFGTWQHWGGRASEAEDIANELLSQAAKAFTLGQDANAELLRNLAQEITDRAVRNRRQQNDERKTFEDLTKRSGS